MRSCRMRIIATSAGRGRRRSPPRLSAPGCSSKRPLAPLILPWTRLGTACTERKPWESAPAWNSGHFPFRERMSCRPGVGVSQRAGFVCWRRPRPAVRRADRQGAGLLLPRPANRRTLQPRTLRLIPGRWLAPPSARRNAVILRRDSHHCGARRMGLAPRPTPTAVKGQPDSPSTYAGTVGMDYRRFAAGGLPMRFCGGASKSPWS